MAPNRRSLTVLVGLVAAMTVSSSLLLMLEPGPIAPPSRVINLRAESVGADGDLSLFDTTMMARPWSSILIYESGTRFDTAQSMAEAHEAAGLGPLPYHFVIENRDEGADHLVRASYRWRHQSRAEAATGPHRRWYDANAVAICLVGDSHRYRPSKVQMRNLVSLIKILQDRFSIPASQVHLHADIDPALLPGQFFPLGDLSLLLLNPSP